MQSVYLSERVDRVNSGAREECECGERKNQHSSPLLSVPLTHEVDLSEDKVGRELAISSIAAMSRWPSLSASLSLSSSSSDSSDSSVVVCRTRSFLFFSLELKTDERSEEWI